MRSFTLGSTSQDFGRRLPACLVGLLLLAAAPCLAAPPSEGSAAYLEGLDALAAAKWSDAAAAFGKAARADEENADYYAARGVAQVLAEQFAKALPDLQRAQRLNPDLWEAKLWICAAYYMSGDASTGSQYVTHGPSGPGAAARSDLDYSAWVYQVGIGYWNCLRGGTATISEGGKTVKLTREALVAQEFPRLGVAFAARRRGAAGGGLAEAIYTRAMALMNRDEYAATLKQLEPLLEASPNEPRYLALQAGCLLELKDYSGARRLWTRLLTTNLLAGNPDQPAGYLQRARAAAAMGDARRARADLDVARSLGVAAPQSVRDEIEKGLAASKGSADPQALAAALDQAVRSNRPWAEQVGAALALEKAAGAARLRCDEAYQDRLRVLGAAVADRPKDADRLVAFAKYLYDSCDPPRDDAEPRKAPLLYRNQPGGGRQREVARAEELVDRALQAKPDHIGALGLKAAILYSWLKFGDAKPVLEKALALKPNNPELLQQMAIDLGYAAGAVKTNALLTRGSAVTVTTDRYPNAGTGTVTVVTRTTVDHEAIARADELDRQADELSQLTEDYTQKALKASAGTPQGFYFKGWLAQNGGDLPAAKDALAEAVRLKPDFQTAWYLLAGVCRRMGLDDEAAAARAAADNLAQTTAVAWLIAAQSDMRHMKLKSARQVLARARQTDPADARIEAYLGASDLADGKPADSLGHLRAALAIEAAREQLHGRTLAAESPLPLEADDIGLAVAVRLRTGAAILQQGDPDQAAAEFQAAVSLLEAMPEADRAAVVPRSYLPNPNWDPKVQPAVDTAARLLIRARAGLPYCGWARQYHTPEDAAAAAQAYTHWMLDFYADHADPDGLCRSVASLGLAELYLKKGDAATAAKVYHREVSGVPQDLWDAMQRVQSQVDAQQNAVRHQAENAQELDAYRQRLRAMPPAQRREFLLAEKRWCEGTLKILEDSLKGISDPDERRGTQTRIQDMTGKISVCDEELKNLDNTP